MKEVSASLEETKRIAGLYYKDLISECEKESSGACVVGLYGDLGSGKTAFVKSFAEYCGVTEEVVSPTFIIERIYKLEGQLFERLIHIDAYRLDDPKELISLGWNEIISDRKNIILLEWPERVRSILPSSIKKIHFTFINETTREIKKV